jgi:hypothetical protein
MPKRLARMADIAGVTVGPVYYSLAMFSNLPGLVIIPFAAGVLTQLVKIGLHVIHKDFSLRVLDRYGGMPSAHSAFVVSLTTALGIREGINSPVFAISTLFSFLTIRDAMGLRQFLGWHSRLLNMLIKELPQAEEQKFPDHIEEQLGHTPLQVFVGGLIGLAVAGLLSPLFA